VPILANLFLHYEIVKVLASDISWGAAAGCKRANCANGLEQRSEALGSGMRPKNAS
jgi:hypothetical protein